MFLDSEILKPSEIIEKNEAESVDGMMVRVSLSSQQPEGQRSQADILFLHESEEMDVRRRLSLSLLASYYAPRRSN